MMPGCRCYFLPLLFAGLIAGQVAAHKPSDSYLTLRGGSEYLTGEWDISLRDLEHLIGLDANQDGEITWGELKDRRGAIAAHALSRLSLSTMGHDCSLEVTELRVTMHSDGNYAVLTLQSDCPGDATTLTVEYNLLFDVDPTHRGLVLYENGGTSSSHVLSPSRNSISLTAGNTGLWQSLMAYIRVGVWHIWIGFDHVLFLLSLLLPAVLVLREKTWEPVSAFRPACAAALKIVTVFTVAHSITLWLAVMEYVTLPSRMVETTIAFSIIVTALNNLYPILRIRPWIIAFVFGLVHGFGFANVLLDLGLSNVTLAISLLGFNLGVEFGQVTIVLLFLPLAYLVRATSFYRILVFRIGSVVIAVIAAIWMYERLFNATILGF